MPGTGTQSFDRAMDLLLAVAQADQGLGTTELARACGLSVGTAHRLLQALLRRGLVQTAPDGKRIVLGLGLFSLAARAAHSGGLLHVARPSVLRVAAGTGDCVFVMARSGFDAVCVDRQDGDYTIKTLTGGIGGATPLGLGTGSLAILSALPEAERKAVLAHNGPRIERLGGRSPSEAEMANIRAQGFVHETSTLLPGIDSLALPITTRRGTPVGSLGIGAIEPRLGEDRFRAALELLRREVACIEAGLAQSRAVAAHA